MALTNSQALPIGNISFTTFQLNGFYSLGEWRRFLFIPYFLMFLLCVIANSILIFLIISQRSLHSPMFVLIGVMAVVDLLMPMFVVPNMLLSFLFDWNQISLLGCLMQIFWVQVFGAFQSTLLLWMALDRFFAICRPLSYHKHMQITNFLKFVIVPVIRNLLINIIMVSLAGKLHFCMKNEIDHCFCEHMGLVQLACQNTSINSVLGLTATLIITTADFIFITVSYAIIFTSVIKSGKSSSKAINTCVTHIIVITFSLVLVLTAFLSYRLGTNASSNIRIFISTMYALFPSCFNPIIYGVRTKEIRLQFLKYFNRVKVFSQ
ncbi:olfactory receptor 52K1-like [Salminus brasiliensis]|uniref:olfactory receptor 52K1-like n=1 Tax=Salminus brasiliensis TaxID=930266 RepID=UPI003B834BDB